jgi:hypothetical protein
VAGHSRLTVRPSIRFAALVAAVIALHAWVLQWLDDALLESPALIKPMATPMFTRLLQPEAPPAPEAKPPPSPAKKRESLAAVRRPAAKPAAKPAARPASPPKPPAAAPASAPEVAASTPGDTTDTLPPVAAASGEVPAAPASKPASTPASAPQPAASAPVTASLDSWPADTRLSYRLTGWYRGELAGSARVQWLRQRERYETRVELDLGILGYTFLSQGEVDGDSLAPRAYQESTPGRTRLVQLGPDSVVLNDGRTVPKPPGVQDTASQFVELSHRFSTGKEKLVIGGTTTIWLARPGGVDLWTYDIVDRELLRTPQLGTIEAFHLKPRPIEKMRGNITAEIWLAPTLQYLPVRIRINQGTESWVDILVDRIEQR